MTLPALLLTLGVGAPAAGQEPLARLSLDVREASILDVLRVLAEVGGFQFVADPGVACSLTLKLKAVEPEKALAVALKSCGLGREDANGIVRVAPIATLLEEARSERSLEQARQHSRQHTVTFKRLSYARAAELAEVVRKTLPPDAQVTFDQRTNTLIIID